MSTILYVHNLSDNAIHAQLLELFSQAGQVSNVFLITDPWTAAPKDFAFVQMATETAANDAIQLLHGMNWLNRALLVHLTTENDWRPM